MRTLITTIAMLFSSMSLSAQIIDTLINKSSLRPFTVSVKVPDGNYRVTVTLGDKKRAAQTVVRTESRRHYTDAIATKKGQYRTVSFVVNKHTTPIDGKREVKLKPREVTYMNWDDSLNISFCGPAPAVQRIRIEPDHQATTVFLCGNSTVVDQENEPWASWGQMITRWFDDHIVVANYAAHTFPGQDKPLADNTHFNPFGAWEVAKMVVMGLKQIQSPLAGFLRADWHDFDPSHPDDPDTFVWHMSAGSNITKPDGN
jgi:hypothetical protein